MEILGTILGPVTEYIISPLGRELSNIFFYKRNIKELEMEHENLKLVLERVQILVNEEKSNSQDIYTDVLMWLEKVDTELQQQTNKNGSSLSCFNKLVKCEPRKIKKRVEHVLELIDDGKKFDKNNVGYHVPLPHTNRPTLSQDYQILESRTLMAKEIKRALGDPNVNKVGISGMGGVGKTKLLDEVKKMVLESNLFNRVIIVTVGQSKDVKQIQDEIAGMLNIKLESDNNDVRSYFLQTKIVEMKDSVLIMLDDLWKEYDLEKDFGIPIRSLSRKEGCKIVMTGRNRNLFTNKFITEKLFVVHLLSENESWKFFVGIVGEFVEVGIERIAKNVVKECEGLPIALKVVAKALKGKTIPVWKDTLKKLNNHSRVKISEVGDKLYTCIKLSYDSIEDEEAKSLFLLCSVFPDDYRISVDDLQMYAMSLGMLNDTNNWEDVRNRVLKLVDDLTSSYLLLNHYNEDLDYRYDMGYCVQMHDVIRDVAKYIASETYKMHLLTYQGGQSEWRKEEKYGSYDAIYVDCEDFSDLPPNFLEFPNLRLLILQSFSHQDVSFKAMENLRVLDITRIHFRPSHIPSLKNLQTLCMSGCHWNNIDIIGELKKLKILKIQDDNLKELPASMSQLKELKVLTIIRCYYLKLIHPNIISSMKKLEELCIVDSFRGWGEEVSCEGKTIQNVRLSELNCLTQLFILRIETQNVDILLNELSLERVQKLQDFYICAGVVWHRSKHDTKVLSLNIKSKIIILKDGILEALLQSCENLRVIESIGFTNTIFKPNENYVNPYLKQLYIKIQEDIAELASPHEIQNITPFFTTHHQVSFSELKIIEIKRKNSLEMLWHNDWLSAYSFCKLQIVTIQECNRLTYLFPSNMIKSLVSLNTLKVSKCELLERIFEIDQDLMDDAKIVVPLTKLMLEDLPNLKYVWNNDPGERTTFPNLKQVDIRRCPQLGSIFPASFMKRMDKLETLEVNREAELFVEDEEVSKRLMMSPKMVLFPNLTRLVISCKMIERFGSFPKLKSLHLFGSNDDRTVPLSLEMSNLVYTIEDLNIRRAGEFIKVFQNGEENEGCVKLKKLFLDNLPKLTEVWDEENNKTKSFDSLESISIYYCENLKCLLPSSITFSNLKELEVVGCNGIMNLFSSSMANKLLNLYEIIISGCDGMSSVVLADREEEEEITFTRLNSLSFVSLQRLKSFYSGKSKLNLPCLTKVYILNCPKIETFSYGIVCIPKLKGKLITEYILEDSGVGAC